METIGMELLSSYVATCTTETNRTWKSVCFITQWTPTFGVYWGASHRYRVGIIARNAKGQKLYDGHWLKWGLPSASEQLCRPTLVPPTWELQLPSSFCYGCGYGHLQVFLRGLSQTELGAIHFHSVRWFAKNHARKGCTVWGHAETIKWSNELSTQQFSVLVTRA